MFSIEQLLNNPAALAAAIVALTAFIRKHVFAGLEGRAVIVISVVVSVLITFVAPLVPAGTVDKIVNAVLIGIMASGAVDAVQDISKKITEGKQVALENDPTA
jgi:hypothetical protein